jgi:uncharacterized protein (DUF1015 family)
MPELHAFRGVRYDLGHVGALSDVVAPPYDVIGPELQEQLYQRHPANVVRLILNRDEPGDNEQNNRYTRAARFLKNWTSEGVLTTDPDPAVYVYHQEFEYEGVAYTRRGFMSRVRLERFGEGRIFPHEETHSAAKEDRLRLTQACQANLSQIFGIYPDPSNTAQQLLEDAARDITPVEAVDHLGVKHRMWPVTDVKTIADLAAAMGPKAVFVADGHHRYETACNYRSQLAATQALPSNHPANFVLMMCVSMNDPGMIVLPTHRLFRGLPPLSSAQLTEKLDGCFSTELAGKGPEAAEEAWLSVEAEDRQGTLALYAAADQQWVICRITEAGQKRMSEISVDHSPDWQSLGVAILHRLVMHELLGADDLPKPTYVHLVSEVREELQAGDADGHPFPLAALVMPATLKHIEQISQNGERMPAKSTYFYPKLLSGLVINPVS